MSAGHACSSTTATGSDTYAYDDSDNRTRVAESNGNTSSDYRYCHDARNQLVGRGSTAACGTSSVESFSYDRAGNRTQAVEAGVTRNFAYTPEGLLCDQETGAAASCTAGNVISDDAGRISDQAGWHYLYDARARLVSACKSSACTGTGFDRVDVEYDGEGHRTRITEKPASGAAVVRTFRYQGDAIAAEYKDGTLIREYTLDPAGTISKVTVPVGQTGAGTYLVTWNGHGDALALYRIESNGTLTLANSLLDLGQADHRHPQLDRRPRLPVPVRRRRRRPVGRSLWARPPLHARPSLQPEPRSLPPARPKPHGRAAVRLHRQRAGIEG